MPSLACADTLPSPPRGTSSWSGPSASLSQSLLLKIGEVASRHSCCQGLACHDPAGPSRCAGGPPPRQGAGAGAPGHLPGGPGIPDVASEDSSRSRRLRAAAPPAPGPAAPRTAVSGPLVLRSASAPPRSGADSWAQPAILNRQDHPALTLGTRNAKGGMVCTNTRRQNLNAPRGARADARFGTRILVSSAPLASWPWR